MRSQKHDAKSRTPPFNTTGRHSVNDADTWGASCPALPPAEEFSTHTVTNVAQVLENTNLYGINQALQEAVAREGAGWARDYDERFIPAQQKRGVMMGMGVTDFANFRLTPIGITDCAGETHQFHFQTRLHGDVVALDAFELREGDPVGYRFQIVGDPEDDLFALLGQLIQKIRRTLSIKHLTDDGNGLRIAEQTVRGRIEWDDSQDGRVPLIVVDGREISWETFGQMLMTFEGWQFKLEIRDPSDEV